MASESKLFTIDEDIEKKLAQDIDSNCYSEEGGIEEEVEKKNEEKPINESGTSGTSGRGLGEMEEQQDVTSNVFQEMQSRLSNLTSDIEAERSTVFSVWISFAEIYNENVYDLLEPIATRGQRRPNLPLGQDSSGQVYIKGLRHIWVTSGEEAYQAMIYGQHNLKFAPTGLNSVSSRSHCIFTIKLLQHKDSELPKFITVSMFSFCDLAGAERLKNTQNVGERLRESQNINTSLHVLGRCLMTIRDNQATKNKKLIPFRDSKLTRLFQRALNGKESVRMIVNVNPSPLLKDETYNVLTFSAIAKQIVLQPERHKKRVTRTSRFSQYIHHNSSRETNDSSASLQKTSKSEALHSQIEKLTDMVENLKACLSAERKEKLNIEKQVREELCDHFSKRMDEQRSLWEAELESTELRYEEINDWRVNKLKEHYEKQISRKRLRDDDDDDYDDSSVADYSNRKSHRDVEYLTERLNMANELTNLEREEKKQLIQKNSELSASLSYCQSELKNAQKIIEATEFGKADENENALILELKNQLKTTKLEFEKKQTKIQELEGVLEDAKVDFTHLENDYNAVEKERNDLDHKLEQMKTENRQHLAALRHKQQLLDQQSSVLDEKDELIKNLKTQLNELQLEIKTKPSNEVETGLQKEIQDLTLKLKESEDEKLNLQKLEEVHQAEICELRKVKDNLEEKLHLTEKAEKEALKNMITNQKSLEEHKKLLEDIKMQSQNKILEMKVKLQSYTDTAALVKSMKQEIENKSSKYDELESENEILKSALETKEIELTRFKENRDEVIKRYEDLIRKEKEESEKHKREINAYQQMFSKNTPTPNKQEFEAKIQKLLNSLDKKDKELEHVKAQLMKVEKQHSKCLAQDNLVLEEGSAKSRRNRKKILDENVYPSSAKSSDKRQLKKESKGTDSRSVEPTRTRSRRRMLFTDNPDDAEFSPVEMKEENTGSLQPERLLRSRRV